MNKFIDLVHGLWFPYRKSYQVIKEKQKMKSFFLSERIVIWFLDCLKWLRVRLYLKMLSNMHSFSCVR